MAGLMTRIGANWFYLVAGLALGVAALVPRYDPQPLPAEWEAAVMLDILVTIPALFVLCYRKVLSRKALALRVLAVQCSGIFLASWIVPESQQMLLTYLYPLRWVGIVVLVTMELMLVATVVRLLFKSGTGTEHLVQQGVPETIARLMLLEARFWRWVFSRFRSK